MPKKKSDTKPETNKSFKKAVTKFLTFISIVVLLAIGIFILSIYIGIWGPLPSKQELKNISHSESTIVYDTDKQVIGKYYLFDRTSIKFDELPEHLIHALVATEDARFYQHGGVDQRSLGRVLIKTLILRQRSAGGGSTITQQLAKNLYPREKHTKLGLAIAKIKESMIAIRLEEIYTKEDLLMLYLNTVSFPDNTYGIESASKKFFNKSVSKLSLSEAAVLVGSLKATYTYNPRLSPGKSKVRRNTVLKQMVKYGYISDATYEDLRNVAIKLNQNTHNASKTQASYFVEQIRHKTKNIVGELTKQDGTKYNIYTDGLKVYTTLDLNMQRHAESAVHNHMKSLQAAFERNWGNEAPWKRKAFIDEVINKSNKFKTLKNRGLSDKEALENMKASHKMDLFSWDTSTSRQGSSLDSLLHYVKLLNTGFVAMDSYTGGIKVWIGGIDYNSFKYDHVNQSKRQVGSTFKPFVYATALEKGAKPCDYIHASTLTYNNYENWTPSNGTDAYDDKYISMQGALSKSINTVAVKLLEGAGIDNVIKLGQAAGIDSELPEVPSLALGTASLKMIELLKAYSIFTHDTSPIDPYVIDRIEDGQGNIIYEHQKKSNPSVISKYTQSVMVEMLQSVTAAGGTASRLRWKYGLDNAIAGKTGTTQSNNDGWFVGITPDLITIAWVGADDSRVHFRETSIGQGANSALPIFGLFYQKLNADRKYFNLVKNTFEQPNDEVIDDLDCVKIKEESFLQSVFDKNARIDERQYDESDTIKEGVVGKLKKLFKKKKR